MVDLLLHRYGSAEYVFKMPLKQSLKLIQKAHEEQNRDRVYQRYLVLLPHMNESNYQSFDEFYQSTLPAKIDTRSVDDIMRDILEG